MARGILLLNMGGPNTIDEVETFLRNMFADPAILPMRPFLRRLIGSRIVTKRLSEARENYRLLGGKSPLTDITLRLAEKIEQRTGLPTLPAMRYVPPFARDALHAMQEQGVDELILFPMYPQYSTTTTQSSYDDVMAQCDALGYHPSIRLVEPYYAEEGYVAVLIDRIVEALGEAESSEYSLILSAHGLPLSIIESGDPYQEHIEGTLVALKKALEDKGIVFRVIELAYQSKVGNAAWLEPNLTTVLRHPKNLKVLIAPIAFTIDNSETLFELDIEHRAIAEKIGYDDYRLAACPNDGEDFATFIAEKIDAL